MKKFLPYILIVLILVGGIGAPIEFGTDILFSSTVAEAFDHAPRSDSSSGLADILDSVTEDVANFLNVNKILATIGTSILNLFGILTEAAGSLLNFTISATVVHMGEIINQVDGINLAWSALRNVANIVLIFILLLIGIATILRIESYGARRLLAGLIIAALLVNFSLFFTKVVVDVSNVFAAEIYQELTNQQASVDCFENTQGCKDPESVTSQIMFHLKLPTVEHNPNTLNESGDSCSGVNCTLDPGKIFLATFIGSIFLLITMFVFFAGAILLAIRFVVLMLLMIFSPLAFVGMVLPMTRGYAMIWWRLLFSQSFFAPLYLLMIWISLQILATLPGTLGTQSPEATYENIWQGNSDSSIVVLNFIIISTLMLASIIIAKQLGAFGAASMIKVGHGARRWGQGFVGRNTAGRAAELLSRATRRLDNTLTRSGTGRAFKRIGVGAGLIATRAASEAVEKAKFGSAQSRRDVARDVSEAKDKEADTEMQRLNNNPDRQARFFNGLSGRQQARLFEKMSARDRASMVEALPRLFDQRGVQSAARLNELLTVDAREQTAEAYRGIAARRAIDRIVQNENNPATGARYTEHEIAEAVRHLPNQMARRLPHEARINPQIIMNMSNPHLRDLMEHGDLTLDEIQHITDVIDGPIQYNFKENQRRYIDDNARVIYWRIAPQDNAPGPQPANDNTPPGPQPANDNTPQ